MEISLGAYRDTCFGSCSCFRIVVLHSAASMTVICFMELKSMSEFSVCVLRVDATDYVQDFVHLHFSHLEAMVTSLAMHSFIDMVGTITGRTLVLMWSCLYAWRHLTKNGCLVYALDVIAVCCAGNEVGYYSYNDIICFFKYSYESVNECLFQVFARGHDYLRKSVPNWARSSTRFAMAPYIRLSGNDIHHMGRSL